METVTIPLTRGKVALIDQGDMDLVSPHSWHSEHNPRQSDLWYAKAKIDGRGVLLHRLILGAPDGVAVDHINRDGLDCRRSNLRICTSSQNRQNSRVQMKNPSGFKGVSWYRRRNMWQAQISKNEKHKHLGYFLLPEDAALAYDIAARQLFGEFARMNFPLPGEQGAR